MDRVHLKNINLDSAESTEAGKINNNLNNSDILITGQSEHTTDKDLENTNQNREDVTFTLDKRGQFVFETNSDTQENNKKNVEVVSNSENIKVSEAIVKTKRPLCADYRSDSDSDSVNIDKSTSTAGTTSETSSDSESDSEDSCDSEDSITINYKKEGNKTKTDFSFSDLPPIEELRISVPEDDCIEIGTVTSIVDTLVVVESYKGTPALDVDTVLFLDCGKRTLGKVFDILGPVSEPVYAVRFNSQEQIKDSQVEKGLKVYCAPKTQHTSFLFLSEIMKHKGSDASWKDNIEAPSEFQDFSDDEEERLHRMNKNSNGNEDGSRKRTFSKSINVVQPVRFRPQNMQPRSNMFPNTQHRPFIRPNAPQMPVQPFQYNVPLYPGNAVLTGERPFPHMYFTPRFSGPPFPSFGFRGQRLQQPFHQQRTHAFPMNWRPPFLLVPPPPPPPPPTSSENDQNFARQS